MIAREALEAAYGSWPPASARGRVARILVRLGNGTYRTPDRAGITVEGGLEGDRWALGARDPDAAVSLMEWRVARLISGGDRWQGVGDNLLVDFDLSETALPLGARVRVGSALLEVSPKPHLGCAKFRRRFGDDALAWVNDKAIRHRRLRGLHTRVIEPGEVALGDAVTLA